MIKSCVLTNGMVEHIGEWNYQFIDIDGEQIPQNPLPEGAVIVDLEVYQDADGAWRVVGHEPPLDNTTALALALAELAEAQEVDKTEIQLALAELAELMTGGDIDG
jgi:hypothetical protein